MLKSAAAVSFVVTFGAAVTVRVPELAVLVTTSAAGVLVVSGAPPRRPRQRPYCVTNLFTKSGWRLVSRSVAATINATPIKIARYSRPILSSLKRNGR